METITALRARAEQRITRHQRAMELSTAALARPRTLYLVVAFVGAWMAANIALPRAAGIVPFDPPPFWLQGLVALSALLMTTLILVTQHRQTRHAEERAQLDLQVNLLAEQKIAKLIGLVEELRRDLPERPGPRRPGGGRDDGGGRSARRDLRAARDDGGRSVACDDVGPRGGPLS